MIQNKKTLNVNASGTMNSNKTRADVDSSSNSTIPIAYRTEIKWALLRREIILFLILTPKYEMDGSQYPATCHKVPKRFLDNRKSQGDYEKQEQ